MKTVKMCAYVYKGNYQTILTPDSSHTEVTTSEKDTMRLITSI